MLRTVIYLVYLLALIGATFFFVLRADAHWQMQKKIRNRLSQAQDKEEADLHQNAFEIATTDAISWTAISICSIYACFDCAVTMLNTL